VLSDVFGAAAAGLTMLFAWPQAIRALRKRRTEGLSLTSTLLMGTSGLLWSVYGLATSSVYILVANLSVACAAMVIASVFRARHPLLPLLLVVGAGSIVAFAALSGPTTTGLVGDVMAGAMTLPQVILALRARTSLAAVSALTYLLLATNAACWIVYGALIADPLVVAPNLVTLPASILILTRLGRPKPRA
jgi:uncharacterized protein with PQ loop repeat